MSDQMSIDPALLPHLYQRLGTLSNKTHSASSAVGSLAAWAGGANPALSGAAQDLTRASRALDDTTTQLEATRRDIDRRASMLDLELGGAARPEPSGARRGDIDPAAPGTDMDDGLLDRWWYALFDYDDHDGVFDFGLGLLHAEMGDTDSTEVQKGSRIDVLDANGKFGLLNPDTGRAGFTGSAQLMGLTWMLGHNSLGIQSLEANVGRVQAESSVGPDGITIGAGASLADAAVTFGQPSKESAADTQVRLGAGLGLGLGGALHWSDDDKDGEREYGFGVDLKFISFDYKSEVLDDAYNLAVAGMVPGLSSEPTRRLEGGMNLPHF